MHPAIPATEQARLQALMLDAVPPGDRRVYAMAGIPGAGKSTFVARARESGRFPAQAFILNPDRVMEALSAYRDDYARLGPEAAFARWEMPARDLAYALAREAASRDLPIIKDMGMVRPENWQMLADFKAQGYAIELHVIDCALETALQGCAVRERHFPPEQMAGRRAALADLLKTHAGLPDALYHYERRGRDFHNTGQTGAHL